MLYKEIVSEIFNSSSPETLPLQWTHPGGLKPITARTQSWHKDLAINFYPHFRSDSKLKNIYLLEFAVDGSFDITGGGDQIVIFNTVIAAAKQFLRDHRPEALAFVGDTPKQRKFFDRLIRRVLSEEEYQRVPASWVLSNPSWAEPDDDYWPDVFLLVRKDLVPAIMASARNQTE